jgi:hypothetical protein
MEPYLYEWIPVASLNDINVKETDLLEDAWGLKYSFPEVFRALSLVQPVASDSLVDGLLSRIETGDQLPG